jgi:hypothetical protein
MSPRGDTIWVGRRGFPGPGVRVEFVVLSFGQHIDVLVPDDQNQYCHCIRIGISHVPEHAGDLSDQINSHIHTHVLRPTSFLHPSHRPHNVSAAPISMEALSVPAPANLVTPG